MIPDKNLRPAVDMEFNQLSSNSEVVAQLEQLNKLVWTVCPKCLIKKREDGALIYVPPERQHAKMNKNLLTMWVQEAGVRMRIMFPHPGPEEEMYAPRNDDQYLKRLQDLYAEMDGRDGTANADLSASEALASHARSLSLVGELAPDISTALAPSASDRTHRLGHVLAWFGRHAAQVVSAVVIAVLTAIILAWLGFKQ